MKHVPGQRPDLDDDVVTLRAELETARANVRSLYAVIQSRDRVEARMRRDALLEAAAWFDGQHDHPGQLTLDGVVAELRRMAKETK